MVYFSIATSCVTRPDRDQCIDFDASAVMVNDHSAFRDDVMPFAGLRESGLGIGGIPYTMEDMQIDKMMVLKSGAL